MATEFSQKVIALIKKIPRGKVATYRQIATLAGKDHAARGVSWILNSSSKKYDLPWHRVLSSQGKISFPPATLNYARQRKKLEQEGVEFSDTGLIDLPRFQWKKGIAKRQ